MKLYMIGSSLVKVIGEQVYKLTEGDAWVETDLNASLVQHLGLPV
jgi:hypothetical protein